MSNEDIAEFVRGQRDCFNGVPHQLGQSEDYTRGYNYEYQLQECKSNNGSR